MKLLATQDANKMNALLENVKNRIKRIEIDSLYSSHSVSGDIHHFH